MRKSKRSPANVISLHERGAFKLQEACAYAGGIAPISIRRLIDRGELKRHPGFRHIVITRAELDRWLSLGNSK
jgi:Helix-turn-helix domain